MKQNTCRSFVVAVLLSVLGVLTTAPVARADTTVGTPITKLPFVIKKPGKYRLIKNLRIDEAAALRAGSAIFVTPLLDAPVVIDLNGFTITGPNTVAAISTIGIDGNTATTVRNGNAFGFGIAVSAHSAEDITVRESMRIGISSIGSGASVRRCKVFSGGTFTPPAADLFAGISGSRVDIEDCSVYLVRSSDTMFYGIIADSGSSVRRCSVRWDLAGDVGFNPASGFRSSGGALVENCMAIGFRHGFDGASMRVQHCYAAGFNDAAFTSVDRGAGNNF